MKHRRSLPRLGGLLLYLLLLAACARPAFEFRGYAADASCDAIVAAETAQGAELVGSRQEDIPGLGAVTVSELRGDVFAAPMFIDVVCQGETEPYGVWYLAVLDDLGEQAATYERLAGILTTTFRPPEETGAPGARVARFHCDRYGLVSLFEGGDEHLAGGGEVSIFIDLRPELC